MVKIIPIPYEHHFQESTYRKGLQFEKELSKKFGPKNGRLIIRRMMLLKAATCLAEVPHTKPERRHELTGKRRAQFAVDLKHPYRLVFKPNHKPLPKKDDGGLDLNRITAITILGVEDYH